MAKPFQLLSVIATAMFLSTLSSHCHATTISGNAAEDERKYRGVIVRFKDAAELDSLENLGVKILRQRGNLALTFFPVNTTRASSENRRARPIERRMFPAMDQARLKYDAFRVTEGTDRTRGYTGRGVVVGICDIGFDPLHPSFRTPEGKCRISRLIQYKESTGERIEMDSEDEYVRWITDNDKEFHATHVAGILAGSYFENGYQGIATDAEMVVTTSELSDVGLLAGAEDIIEYAKSVGKPAVINLSVGSYNGAHDGTSLFSQYIDMLGEEAIICLAAGNEGTHTNTLQFDFTPEKLSVKTRLGNRSYNQHDMYGMTDIWSADSSRISIRPFIFDDYTKTEIYSFPVLSPDDDELTAFATVSADDFPDAVMVPEVENYLQGYFLIYGGLDPNVDENRRYRVNLEYDMKCQVNSPAGPWGRYNIGFEVTGKEGTHIDIYADGQYTRLMGYPEEPSPGTSVSVSDIACGKNVISVGMYCNRFEYPLIDGSEEIIGIEPGVIVQYSGYGTLLDGRVLPLTVGPGYQIISSISSPFVEKNSWKIGESSAVVTFDGRNSYWAANGGTSMSCPYVAGYLATWLEADPTLTIDKVKDIIVRTNMHDYPDPENPRHGQGWFNPYGGLLEVLEGAGIESIDIDENRCRIIYYRSASTARIICADDASVVWNLFSADGRHVLSGKSTGSVDINLSGLSSGIYILKVSADGTAPRTLRLIST